MNHDSLTSSTTSASDRIPHERHPKHGSATPVAIIGISGSFPASPDLDALWNNLRDGKDCVGVLPVRDRWGVDEADVDILHAGVLEGIECFQSAFFDISPREAAWMDPQQRLLMVHVWKAIEDAGYAPKSLDGKNVAVLLGTGNSGYSALCAEMGRTADAYSACGSVPSIGPNRISNFLNLHGPSGPVETACSSSLVALHRGASLLQSGECDWAIVGGVNTIVSLDLHAGLARAKMLSPDGKCRPFSAKANGYVRGEGVGIVLLKRLADAERDRDPIHGVVLGSAENHCGRTASLTAPNSIAQAAVIHDAIRRAGIDPATITYVEAHGTGTALGDPIEVKGLTKAFASPDLAREPLQTASCALGSIKGNIGHLELSAGIAGVIKVLMQMKHGTLAKSLHAESPSVHIDFRQGPFHLVDRTQPWPRRIDADGRPLPRRAGVSSFGFGGVNAHVVLEEYVAHVEDVEDAGEKTHPVVLSADSEKALRARAGQLARWAASCEQTPHRLEQVAYTLMVGRNPMDFRLGFEASSLAEVSRVLHEFVEHGDVISNDTFVRGCAARRADERAAARSISGMSDDPSGTRRLLESWVNGADVDWGTCHRNPPPIRVNLPTYPFDGERIWPAPPRVERTDVPTDHDTRGDLHRDVQAGATEADPSPVRVAAVKAKPAPARRSATAHETLRSEVTLALVRMAKDRGTGLVEDIDPDAEFGALGFDSLDMADLGLEIRDRLGIDLATTVFFEHPTLRKLSHFLADEFFQALADHFALEGEVGATFDDASCAAGSEAVAGKASPPAEAEAAVEPDAAVPGLQQEPVAIVGMSGAFPMSSTLDDLWQNLREGKDCIGRLPLVERWNVPEDAVAVSHAGVLDATEWFDPLFFGISPREAEAMDPQQRLLMMHAWAAIEDAGHAPHTLSNERIAVIIGTGYSGYGTLLNQADTKIEGYSAAGLAVAMGPNRTSYFLNLRGPSEPIDTACSSSLVALHRAVHLIRDGECDSAIAGGVNTLISLDVQNSLAKAGMLSPEGRCKTFSARADGYVRSEGVGMLYVKRLSAARRDGDHVYALIKGSAVNHGGRTASLTAPSPQAQSAVVREAMREAAVDPATITYVEAHGTGTPLGDPVEVSGLTQAFREMAAGELPSGFCGIGSIKSNVGHLEMCAGVAGVIKVLLQIKHGTLVKSLHADELNGRIDFDASPFFVVQQATRWERLKDEAGKDIPRRAGVSSFGFGGVNAHVVLEEYLAPAAQGRHALSPGKDEQARPIVLSAQSSEALVDKAHQLLAWIDGQPHLDADRLERLAYTLQIGREAMKHRLGFLASDKDELVAGLRAYVTGTRHAGIELLEGVVAKNRSAGTSGASESADASRASTPSSDAMQLELLRRWIAGMPVDWTCLYQGVHVERISLPTYPFRRDRYWPRFPRAAGAVGPEQHVSKGLRVENASVLGESRFRTTFDPQDAFLRDHVLAGVCVVPAAVAIQMSRQAIAAAFNLDPASERRVRLTDIMFPRPMAIPQAGLSVIVVLTPEADGRVSYLIRDEEGADHPGRVYCRGRAALCDRRHDSIDVPLQRDDGRQAMPAGDALYAMLAEHGLALGKTYQTLQGAWRRGSKTPTRRAFACVSTGDQAANGRLDETCGGAALDGALQIVAAADLASGQPPGLPFAVESIEFHAPLPRNLVVTLEERAHEAAASPRRYDIAICDEAGAVCVSVSGFVTRGQNDAAAPKHAMPATRTDGVGPVETMLFRQALVPVDAGEQNAAEDPAETLVILCGIDVAAPASAPEEHWCHVPFRGASSAEAFLDCLSSLFSRIAEVARQHRATRTLQVVVPRTGPAALLGRLDGTLKSISDEHRAIRFQLLIVPETLPPDTLLAFLRFGRSARHPVLMYPDTPAGGVSARVWQLVTEQQPAPILWKEGGVYLVTGGLGAIGRVVARDIASTVRGATVVLVSRDSSDATNAIAALQQGALQARIVVKSADVGERAECAALVADIVAEFGRLDGILHCAGVVADAGFLNRPVDGLRTALRPKAEGGVNLDEATADLDLDFFVCFSSLASSHGNPGQVDYAASNAFMDACMDQRAQQVRDGTRRGHSLSINWPLWRDGGMQASVESSKRQLIRFGMVPISTEAAMAALRGAMALRSESGVAIVEGVRALLPPNVLDPARSAAPGRLLPSEHRPGTGVSESKIAEELLHAVSKATQVPVERISAEQPFSEYGVDSILASDLTTQLEARFGPLERTVLFEYPTIRTLAHYLVSKASNFPAERAAPSIAPQGTGAARGRAMATPADLPEAVDSHRRLVAQLRATIADAVGMPIESISETVPFSEYGVDSILVLDLTTRLEQGFGPLQKTVFFEYPTVRELAHHLQQTMATHRVPGVSASDMVRAQEAPPAVETRSDAHTHAGPLRELAPVASAIASRSDPHGPRDNDIAVVGLSGRYPQSPDLERFWENLSQGVDCIQEIPPGRWDWRGRAPRNRWGGFMEGVDRFDPLLFNISPRDAERIDPQERLFLQCAFSALEDAGYTPDEFGGEEIDRQVGVFVGVMYEEYQLYAVEAQTRGIDIAVSGSAASVANRVSYSFNFRGPSIALDTMCSSSLTAIHLACQSIQSGDCRSAIAGGVNVSIHPNKYLLLHQAKFESPDGRCPSFGRGGNGYVPAEGVGAVVLKTLSAAIRDGDHVYAVIRGSAINAGGRSQGYTAPNPEAQAAVIASALRRSGVDARSISYVEAHGTGTHLGDPIEIAGLARAFAPFPRAEGHCAIGSVKSNIGHAEAAAGIAGFTKVLLQMKHGMLVPSLHSEELNPLIDFERTPFRVQRHPEKWEPSGRTGEAMAVRRAAVSSFGAGGANAHIVLEDYPARTDVARDQAVVGVGSAFVLSARTEDQLRRSAVRLMQWLEKQSLAPADLMDVAYTLQIGRVPREFRLGLVAKSVPEVLGLLAAYLQSDVDDMPDGISASIVPPGGGNHPLEEPVLDAWAQSDQVEALLSAWMAGANLPWRRWHSPTRRRISLPTYPFAEDRYWIETGASPMPASAVVASDAPSFTTALTYLSHADALEQIRGLLASLLRVPVEALDAKRSLEAYGIDSILLMEFSDELDSRFGLELGSAELFLQPSIDALIAHVASRIGDPLMAPNDVESHGNGDGSLQSIGTLSGTGHAVGLGLLNTPGGAVAIFYPTHTAGRAVRMGAFTLSVAVNAAPVSTAKGLIVICHGREGSQLMHHDIAEHLASAGYVVAALEHPTDSWKDASLAESAEFFSTRPREAWQAINAVVEHPAWKAILRDLPVGMVAHSAGAIDALSLLGARVTVQSASDSPAIRRQIPAVASLSGGRHSPGADHVLTPDLTDPRLHACVLLAPFTEPFDRESLSEVDTPVRIYLAQQDETLDNAMNGRRAKESLPNCEVRVLPEFDHFAFIAPTHHGEDKDDKRREVRRRLRHEIEAFFDECLAAQVADSEAQSI